MQKFWFQEFELRKLPALDAARGFAAFWVFCFHFWGFFCEQNFCSVPQIFAPFFRAGHLGVDIFFVLSGLLLFLSFAGKFEQNFWTTSKRFFARRFRRLFPLVAVFVTAVFILKFEFRAENFADFFAHLFFLQSLFFETYWGLNPVMWTLTVEFLFILILPILFFLGRKSLKFFLGILGILFLANFFYRFWIFQFFENWTTAERIFFSEQLWGRFDQFALGIFCGIAISHFSILIARFPRRNLIAKFATFFGAISAIFFAAIFANLNSAFREIIFGQIFLHFLFAFSFAIFIGGMIFSDDFRGKKFFAPQLFAQFSKISFGFFLWHFPVLSILKKVGADELVGFFGGILIAIFLSIFSLFFVEKFFEKLLKSKF